MGKRRDLPEKTSLPCCGCSGTVIFVTPSESGEDRPTFFHTMPYCKRFDDTNTAEAVLKYFKDCAAKVNLLVS